MHHGQSSVTAKCLRPLPELVASPAASWAPGVFREWEGGAGKTPGRRKLLALSGEEVGRWGSVSLSDAVSDTGLRWDVQKRKDVKKWLPGLGQVRCVRRVKGTEIHVLEPGGQVGEFSSGSPVASSSPACQVFVIIFKTNTLWSRKLGNSQDSYSSH